MQNAIKVNTKCCTPLRFCTKAWILAKICATPLLDFQPCTPGVANLFGERAKLFEKLLQRAFFTPNVKINKS
jgi:hypothetical protein